MKSFLLFSGLKTAESTEDTEKRQRSVLCYEKNINN